MHAPIPLDVYAHIVAALGEGYRLAEILEHEGLSEDAWEEAEERWVDRLDESAEADLALHDELDRAVWRARQRFARAIDPLDHDVGAWLVFQHHVATSPHMLAALADHGLFLGDWVRLNEAWAERLSADPDGRAEALRALPKLAEAPLPDVRPGPRMLPAPLFRATPVGTETNAAPEMEEPVPWGLDGIVSGKSSKSGAPRSPDPDGGTPPTDIALPSYLHSVTESADAFARVAAEAPLIPSLGIMTDFRPSAADAEDACSTLLPIPLSQQGLVLPFHPSPVPLPSTKPSRRALMTPEPRPEDTTLAPLTLDAREHPIRGADLPFRAPMPGAPAVAPPSPPPGVSHRAAGEPSLSLEHYAALCAELAVFPQAVEETFQRYHLASLRDRLTVDLTWRERLRRNPTEGARWQALYAHYTAHFAARGSGQ
jgi:hypothetical protein